MCHWATEESPSKPYKPENPPEQLGTAKSSGEVLLHCNVRHFFLGVRSGWKLRRLWPALSLSDTAWRLEHLPGQVGGVKASRGRGSFFGFNKMGHLGWEGA